MCGKLVEVSGSAHCWWVPLWALGQSFHQTRGHTYTWTHHRRETQTLRLRAASSINTYTLSISRSLLLAGAQPSCIINRFHFLTGKKLTNCGLQEEAHKTFVLHKVVTVEVNPTGDFSRHTNFGCVCEIDKLLGPVAPLEDISTAPPLMQCGEIQAYCYQSTWVFVCVHVYSVFISTLYVRTG